MFEDVPPSVKQQGLLETHQSRFATFSRMFTRGRVAGMLVMLTLVLVMCSFCTEPGDQVSHRRLFSKGKWYDITDGKYRGNVGEVSNKVWPATKKVTMKIYNRETGMEVATSEILKTDLDEKGWFSVFRNHA